jgi:hypothetical protein
MKQQLQLLVSENCAFFNDTASNSDHITVPNDWKTKIMKYDLYFIYSLFNGTVNNLDKKY